MGICNFAMLLLRSFISPKLPWLAVLFSYFFSQPSLSFGSVLVTNSTEVFNVMEPGACCSEGHHGYLLLLLVTSSVCPGTFPTPINWRCGQTFSCGPFTCSCTVYIVQSTLTLWTPRYNKHPANISSS